MKNTLIVMNRFPFAKIDYNKYKYTFLQNVVFDFEYNSSVSSEVLKESFIMYLRENFDILLEENKLSEEMTVKSSDTYVSFVFKHNFVQIQLVGQKYSSFISSALPQLYKLKSFFESVVQTSCSKIRIRKINTWNFKDEAKNGLIDVIKIRDLIFSPELISALSDKDLTLEERKIDNFQKTSFCEKNKKLEIRSAFLNPISDKDKFYHLIMDTVIESSLKRGQSFDETLQTLRELNSDMYNAFHWSISEYIINIMKSNN